ncbi:S-adenosyl-L-methionine-dependent methyltransferase [Podospora didyma]|uniref:S-adenosyl-L-methionine-dependent methyltransferase n=1 Tax=Podospora didyma TaxID=330526 RepID=A0AAE0NFY7_9PEZI|nr:S-adenosyl-L-methionine-dependent methyltransferase [Podospora didyma]
MSMSSWSDIGLAGSDWASETDGELIDREDCGDSDVFSGDEFDSSPHKESAASSAVASVNSSIRENKYYRGRRYQMCRFRRYLLPNDIVEQDREDLQHLMTMELTGGKRILAPIGNHPRRILDLGTGTGIWAVEVGDRYPFAEVAGVDLSPIQPRWTPPNVNFYIDDIEEEWMNGSDFDLIHARNICRFIQDPAALLRKSFDNLKPGGWIELQDIDDTLHCDDNTMINMDEYPVAQFLDISAGVWAGVGADARIAPSLGQLLETAGFNNVSCKKFKVPIGAWPRDAKLKSLGTYFRVVLEMLIPAICVTPAVMAEWTETKADQFAVRCRQSVQDASVHSYMYFYFWQGQKPPEI